MGGSGSDWLLKLEPAADRRDLVGTRGCSFDVPSGTDLDTDEPRRVYFLLGASAGEDGGNASRVR